MSKTTILSVWGALATVFIVSSSALHLPSLNALTLDTIDRKFKIDLIDVKCDKNEDGMHVTIQFAEPFDGVIYSQGYFSDPKCRYVAAGESEQTFNFVVPFGGCGSRPSCAICDSIDNILIIQQDDEVQGEFDAARKISCSRTGVEEEKKIFFKPFIVEMLDVVTVPTSHGGVDCWMDIQRGIYPQLTAIGQAIKIGEQLSVLVYLRDEKNEYDLSVRNCWAYDSENFDDKKTGKVQLSDASGCSMKRKLFGSWHKTDKTGSSGATLLLHNTLRAFKFPDESQVYLKCDIEICLGTCAEAICEEINKVDCSLDPLNANCIRDKMIDRLNIPIGFTTLPTHSYKTSSSSSISTRVPFTTTRKPILDALVTNRFNYIPTTVSDQQITTEKSFECSPGSRDIRCIQLPFGETTQMPEITTYREHTTYREQTTYPNQLKTTTTKEGLNTFCSVYPKHKRCNQRVTDDLNGNIEILTFKPPSPFATVKYRPTPKGRLDCSLNPDDYRCKKLEIFPTTISSRIEELPFNCRGENLDPRCPNPTPTNTPPTYLPPSTTRKIISSRIETSTLPDIEPTTYQPVTQKATKKFFICVPGSNDVNCDFELTKTTEESPVTEITTIPSRNQYTTTKQREKPICVVGSTNPECKKVSTDILTFKPRPSTTPIPRTTLPKRISTTRSPICYPGSSDPRCLQPTTLGEHSPGTTTTEPSIAVTEKISTESVISRFGTSTSAPRCYPGSVDPRCSRPTTTIIPEITSTQRIITEIPETTTYRILSTTRVPQCNLGSLDARCSRPTATQKVPSISTTQDITTELPDSTTSRFISSTNIAPRCYPGSPDPRCRQQVSTRIPITSTAKPISSTTNAPRCYLGSLDPRCIRTTTTKQNIPPIDTRQEFTTERSESTTFTFSSTNPALRCYPGSPDPRCSKPTTTKPTESSITTTEIPTRNLITKFVSTTTTAPRCYPGSLDIRCRQSTIVTTTTKPFIAITEKTSTEGVTSRFGTSTSAPRCYPGSLDPRCSKTTSKIIPAITTTQKMITEIPETSTYRISTSTRAPLCYPGSLDPRCSQRTTEKTTTQNLITRIISSTTTAPRCYLGSSDPRCNKPSSVITEESTSEHSTTKFNPLPRCYPGSSDPRCPQQIPTRIPITSTARYVSSTTSAPRCYPGALDPRCVKTTTAKQTIPPIGPRQEIYTEPPQSSTPKIISSTSTAPRCYLGSLDSRCAQPTISTKPTYVTKESTTTEKLISTIPSILSTTKSQTRCYPGSLDPSCKSKLVVPLQCGPGPIFDPRCPNPTPTAEPATYLPPQTSPAYKTTKPTIITSTAPPRITCLPNSNLPGCRTTTPTKFTPSISTESLRTTTSNSPETTPNVGSTSTTTAKPPYITSSKPPFSFPTFTTSRISTPGPFSTRSTVTTTTENILCYPGSPIAGCNTSFTTPSFCYPGSKDKRCPQLPPSFSTREPSTYLPPYPDARFNRVKREALNENEPASEIVKFSLSFKPYSLS